MGVFNKIADKINVWSVEQYKKKKQEHEAYLEETVGKRAVEQILKEVQDSLSKFTTEVIVCTYSTRFLDCCKRQQLVQYLPKVNEELKNLGWVLIPNDRKNESALRASADLFYAELETLEWATLTDQV